MRARRSLLLLFPSEYLLSLFSPAISDECALQPLPLVLQYGRTAYRNIQKFTQIQLTAVIFGILISFIAAICLWDSPLTTIQLVWMNFFTCLVGGLMIVMESTTQDSARLNSPCDWNKPLLTKSIWKRIATQVMSQTSLLLIIHLCIKGDSWKPLVCDSFMLCQLLNQFRTMGILVSKKAIFYQYWFLPAVVSVMMMQVVLVVFGKSLAGCETLN
ncbi:putative calcium-transporting ATPase 13, plasma membrane-type [Mercurialis annua]|uniref:putative calcium-transporting ATPase 13, plasma membrane-type n=1 Tax=Mercurialis annua TaxID=3986 RepID=UPI00215E9C42|nr:putative calcium-transporting ATPase 13, plasma membrane-type [Mercurialis annua]